MDHIDRWAKLPVGPLRMHIKLCVFYIAQVRETYLASKNHYTVYSEATTAEIARPGLCQTRDLGRKPLDNKEKSI